MLAHYVLEKGSDQKKKRCPELRTVFSRSETRGKDELKGQRSGGCHGVRGKGTFFTEGKESGDIGTCPSASCKSHFRQVGTQVLVKKVQITEASEGGRKTSPVLA